eukprot:scaffold188935_cov20-Tisochrysis_lutea.AAC.1
MEQQEQEVEHRAEAARINAPAVRPMGRPRMDPAMSPVPAPKRPVLHRWAGIMQALASQRKSSNDSSHVQALVDFLMDSSFLWTRCHTAPKTVEFRKKQSRYLEGLAK